MKLRGDHHWLPDVTAVVDAMRVISVSALFGPGSSLPAPVAVMVRDGVQRLQTAKEKP
jgi:hypothetical protein